MTTARDLSNRLACLLREERTAMADFLVVLARFDRERRWADLGHANLFAFLHLELGLSRGAAHYRKVASGLVQQYPELVDPLRDGRLCLTAVVELAKVITPANRAEVPQRFFHCSKREAKEVSAAIAPRPAPAREVVSAVVPRPIDVASLAASESPVPVHPDELGRADGAGGLDAIDVARPGSARPIEHVDPDPRVRASSRPESEPLTADLRRLHVTVTRRFLAKLQATRDALSHARPGASTEEVLEACMDLMLEKCARRKGLLAKPRKTARAVKPETVTAAVRREVWHRAGGRCEWKLPNGERCGSTVRLELDHVVPKARGGPSTIENLRLTCRSHNVLAARKVFGNAWMEQFRWSAPAQTPTGP
jgi:hypothetical protein